MPTYEFRCPDGHTFERFYRKMSDGVSEVECPTCGKVATRQLTGGAGLVFKGSGFYLTDYGKNAHRGEGTKAGASQQADGDPGGSSSGAESGSGDSKAADTKADAKPAESTVKETKSQDAKSSDGKGGGAKAAPPAPSSSSPKTDK